MSLVEKVARAIYQTDAYVLDLDGCRTLARAALEACLEPTQKMVDAGTTWAVNNWDMPEDVVGGYIAMLRSELESPTE